jgi:hypothetical protein
MTADESWVVNPVADYDVDMVPAAVGELLAPKAPDSLLVWRLGACLLAGNTVGRDKVLVESGLDARGCRLLVAAGGEVAKAVMSNCGDDLGAAEAYLEGLIDRQLGMGK